MLDSIRSWWHRKHIQDIKRSSKEQDRLTEWECEEIRRTGGCPDCGGPFQEGPHGGLAVNYICLSCHSEFNLTFIAEAVIGERISDRGPREIGERAWAYGL